MMNKNNKSILALTLAALLLTVAVSGTLAYLVDVTPEVKNTFTPARVTCDVVETFANNVKSSVMIKNTGTTSAYIRAMVVANWCDADGNIVEPFDVSSYLANGQNNWVKSGNYYYYQNVVAADGLTGELLVNPIKQGTPPAGADHLVVTIVCQAVQSEPKTAVTQAWGSNTADLLN